MDIIEAYFSTLIRIRHVREINKWQPFLFHATCLSLGIQSFQRLQKKDIERHERLLFLVLLLQMLLEIAHSQFCIQYKHCFKIIYYFEITTRLVRNCYSLIREFETYVLACGSFVENCAELTCDAKELHAHHLFH